MVKDGERICKYLREAGEEYDQNIYKFKNCFKELNKIKTEEKKCKTNLIFLLFI